MSKVILVSPDYKSSYKNIDTDSLGYKIIPFGLAYLGSILKKHGHDVKIIDLNVFRNPLREFKCLLKKGKPDFVGISCTTPSMNSVAQIAEVSKNVSKRIKIIVGGYHPTALPSEVMENGNIDFLLLGEGEKSIAPIVNGIQLKKIHGLVYKKNGKIIKNPEQNTLSDLDTLPYPIYSEFYKTGEDAKDYGIPTSKNTTGLVESRGCYYNCIFCANKLMGKGKVRLRSPKGVISEIEMLYQKYGITNFSFYDSALMLDEKRLYKICQEIIKKEFKIKWTCSSRVDLVKEETLKIMRKSGCISIYFGIESGDPRILNVIKKGITLEQVEKTIRMAKKVGITCVGLFMLGHPYETEESANNTVQFAKKLPLDYAEFNIVIPLPGTELWHMAKEKRGIEVLTKNWGEYTAYGKPAIRTLALTSEQLENYQKKAYKQFYFRPNYIFKKIINKNFFQDFKKSIILLKFLIQK